MTIVYLLHRSIGRLEVEISDVKRSKVYVLFYTSEKSMILERSSSLLLRNANDAAAVTDLAKSIIFLEIHKIEAKIYFR